VHPVDALKLGEAALEELAHQGEPELGVELLDLADKRGDRNVGWHSAYHSTDDLAPLETFNFTFPLATVPEAPSQQTARSASE
jgi:hypothetical protein